MTAAHILGRWRRVRGVLGQYSLWFTLLHIAEAGERGIIRSALAQATGIHSASLTYSMRKLREAGLVREWQAARTSKARPALIAAITPKGLEFLGLNPTPQEAGA